MDDRPTIKQLASWRATAAYLYTLDLSGPALAWEYLRRDVDYLQAWRRFGRRLDSTRWGLRRRRRSATRCEGRQPIVADRDGRRDARRHRAPESPFK